MKKCAVFMVCIVLFVSDSLLAQGEGGAFTSSRLAALKTGEGSLGNNPSALNWFNDLRDKMAKLGEETKLSLDDIDGTVYLDENFKNGTIYYRNSPYGDYLLRYDAYNDEVELKRNGSRQIEALHRNENISCKIQNDKLFYLKHKKTKGKVLEGYLVALQEGVNYTLYIKRQKIFKQGKVAQTSLQNSFPPRFVDDVSYFVSIGDEIPIQIGNSKKEILSLFGPDQAKDVKTYLKENRPNLKEEGGLISLFAYANTL